MLALLSLAIVHTTLAAGDANGQIPPIAGQPVDFSGAVGSFKVTTRAQPREVQAEDSLTLTLRITGRGDLQAIRRPELRKLPQFSKRFEIGNLSDRFLQAEQSREFDYRLRPRSAAVDQVPPLPFVYWKPGIVPPEKGYQTTYAAAIPLTVRPRPEVTPDQLRGGTAVSAVPDTVRQIVAGPIVLHSVDRGAIPGRWVLAVLILGPPALCGLWYILWLRAHPDQARSQHQPKSKAVQNALESLRRLKTTSHENEALQAGAILADYLRHRWRALPLEPTPAEIAARLEEEGYSPAVVKETTRFFEHCDAARFAPGMDSTDDASASAVRLLLALDTRS